MEASDHPCLLPPRTPTLHTGPETSSRGGGAAVLVGSGVFLSRVAGLIRQRVFAHYLGLSGEGDAFAAAFRIPNVLQNLFGEGALSASFIPAYAKLLATGDEEGARRLAGGVAALLALVTSVLVVGGMAIAPWLLSVIAPGFSGERRALAITLVRILFPGTGLLVMAAWCLGILNSHGRFFRSYVAPVAWNAAIIVALLCCHGENASTAAMSAAWGAVIGSVLQIAVQWPAVRSVTGRLHFRFARRDSSLGLVIRNFIPALMSRGVIQISAYVDTVIATLLPIGAVIAITNAQTLYILPVSLFGIAIAASELPALSATTVVGSVDQRRVALQSRLADGWERLTYFIIPSMVALIGLGGVLAAALFQTGAFGAADAAYVGRILFGASIGLLPSAAGRLWSTAFYAVGDTRTPLRFAVVRVSIGTAVGTVAALFLPGWLGMPPVWGAPFLMGAGAVAAWTEFFLLSRELRKQSYGIRWRLTTQLALLITAVIAVGVARMSVFLIAPSGPVVAGGIVVGIVVVIYGGATTLGGHPTARAMVGRIRSGLGR